MISDQTKHFAKLIHKKFNNMTLLEEALTHKSWSAENEGTGPNEKLEFLGDSVLGLIVTEHIYATYPELTEGQLSQLRSVIVGKNSLKRVAKELNLGSYLKLGNATVSDALLEDAIEAIIGAIYLDDGWSSAKDFVLELLGSRIDELSKKNNEDYKSRLKMIFEKQSLAPPKYSIQTEGPDHEKIFFATVRVGDEIVGNGQGSSKKEAEQVAAGKALKRFINE
ncbi:MAG: ribonuclease III [Acidimicrobiaceae bacterium]|nr:ribonuclease III [Acidimicrobiaceae bacterium]